MNSAIFRLGIFLGVSWICRGFPDIPFFYEAPTCSDRNDASNPVPFYEFDKPMQPFDRRSEPIFLTDISSPTPIVSSENWKDLVPNNQDIQYFVALSSPQSVSKTNLNRRKRSLDGDGMLNEGKNEFSAPFMAQTLPLNRNKENIKTIYLSSSFTPRLGRKRSSDNVKDTDDTEESSLGSSRSRVIDVRPGNAFTPRLGRSESLDRIQLNAGSAFTPRLGRSEGQNRIQLNAGSAFTPRLGRSEDQSRIQFNAGSAFTPRLGRSEDQGRIQLNAGSAFTPRLGRSEAMNRITLNAGNAFTPRLGRSEGRRISLNAGGAFTPRLG